MVKGLPVIHEQSNTHEDCMTCKHQRGSLPTSTSQAKEHLELVHTYIWGPMQTQSIGGSFYFLLMILAGKHGFISLGTNQRPSPSLKSSRLSLVTVKTFSLVTMKAQGV